MMSQNCRFNSLVVCGVQRHDEDGTPITQFTIRFYPQTIGELTLNTENLA